MKNSQDLLERIAVNPKIMGGKPVVKGTRVTVEQILTLKAQELSVDDILRDYPHLCREDISAVLLYAAKLADKRRSLPHHSYVELKEIRSLLSAVNRKLDCLLEEKETESIMALEEQTFKEFLSEEPDIYSLKD
jgi:uncharacterized protein (DUF433 family)